MSTLSISRGSSRVLNQMHPSRIMTLKIFSHSLKELQGLLKVKMFVLFNNNLKTQTNFLQFKLVINRLETQTYLINVYKPRIHYLSVNKQFQSRNFHLNTWIHIIFSNICIKTRENLHVDQYLH